VSGVRARKPGWLVILGIVLLAFLMAAAWGTREGARKMAFFRVRAVEVKGARYMSPHEIVARLRVDTLASLWDDTEPLRRRLMDHPQITSVAISRRMPGTLIVTVVENLPVALVATAKGLVPFDALGRELPIDPTRQALDLPVVASNDPVLLKLVGAVRSTEPRLFGRLEEVRRSGRHEIVLSLAVSRAENGASGGEGSPQKPRVLRVRALAGLSVVRLADIFPVESDLARRNARVVELDLRYRDQVIARLQ